MAIKTRASAPAPAVSSDWQDAPTEFDRRRVIMDIIGPEGTGRSSLALTAPGPMAYINSDEKIQGVIQRYAREKSIKVATYGFTATGNKQADIDAANPVWNRVLGWMRDAKTWAKTTVFDTATEGWEMCRLGNFGELNPKGRVDSNYGPVNAEFRGAFKQYRGSDCNLISIHQVKDVYIDKLVNGQKSSIRTGATQRAGFKEFGYIADVVVETSKVNGVFRATITKGWWNATAEGLTLENEDITFANIMSMITETEQSEWL